MKHGLGRTIFLGLTSAVVLGLAAGAQADVRMIGFTGNLEANAAHDQSMYEFDQNDLSADPTFLQQLTLIRDTVSMGYNPMQNLIFRAGGGPAWTDDPNRRAGGWPYRDNQYLETVDLDTGALTAIYNANGPNLPDPDNFFIPGGLPAPRPSWIYPQTARTLAQTDNSYRQILDIGVGANEVGAIRGWAWNQAEGVFYVSSDMDYDMDDPENPGTLIRVNNNIFKLTPGGDAEAVGFTGFELKGLTFYHPVPGQTVLLGGDRDEGKLYTIDPATAQPIGTAVDITMVDENGTVIGPSGGLLGLTQDPVTGDLIGINHSSDATIREILKIDPITGNAEVIGLAQTSADEPDAGFASLLFAGYQISDMDQNHRVDFDDIAAFVLGINNAADYEAAYGVPTTLSGDNTGNGQMDFDDIAGFVASLTAGNGTAAVPEPASIVLLGLGLVGILGLRRRRR